MRLPVVAAFAALTLAGLAGSAVGQAGPVYGREAPLPDRGSYGPVQTAPALGPFPNLKRQAAISSAVHQYQIACRTDLDSLCNAKWRHRADECLVYHRLRLTSSCKQAMDRLIVAKRG